MQNLSPKISNWFRTSFLCIVLLISIKLIYFEGHIVKAVTCERFHKTLPATYRAKHFLRYIELIRLVWHSAMRICQGISQLYILQDISKKELSAKGVGDMSCETFFRYILQYYVLQDIVKWVFLRLFRSNTFRKTYQQNELPAKGAAIHIVRHII